MKHKKIAMISYHTCPLASQEGKETGGMNVYVLELSKKLASRGIQVDIFTRSQDVDNPEVVEVLPNLRVIHIVAGPQTSLSKREIAQYIPDFVNNYQRFTEAENISYEVLHCHYYLSGLIGKEIQKKVTHHLPLVMTFHTLALMKNLVARDQMEKEGKERIEAEFFLTRHADKIICPSENDASYLHYLYSTPKEKIEVIPPGVNTDIFKPMDKKEARKKIQADEDHKLVLFAGRIEPLKGIDVLIYAMKILIERSSHISVCLWIVGGDVSQEPSLWSSELQKLEELRRLLNIPTSVNFVGQKTQEELVYYYNAAEVVVMPSHYESFGMAAAEAMSCGVPVITTNVSGISGLIDEKHSSLITSVNNPLLLASQIEHVITDHEAYQKSSKEIWEKVQDLNWQVISQKILEVYEKVI
jgi:D-inositol-3-phosphate glycosyltransferase